MLDDVVEYNGLVLREWGAMLTRVGALDGLVGRTLLPVRFAVSY